MSSSKFHDNDQARREMNGPRPSPLKIKKDSHFIHKSSSSSSISSNSSSSSISGAAAVLGAKQQTMSNHHQPHRHPVIIYTHSPKIIHTQARDFMALVQKLTGMSRSDDETVPPQPQQAVQASNLEGNNNMKRANHDNNESSSVLTDENCGVGANGGGVGPDIHVRSSSVSPIFNQPNPYFADIPLFTPNSTDFYCSPRPVYRYPDSMFASPNMGNSISPSVLEFMKGLPEY